MSASVTAALVLPFSALCVWLSDQACNYLQGDIAVAERRTPRGVWCEAIQWHQHWVLLLLGPALLAFVLVLVVGRRPWFYVSACAVGGLAAAVPVIVMNELRAYPLF